MSRKLKTLDGNVLALQFDFWKVYTVEFPTVKRINKIAHELEYQGLQNL